MIGTLWPYLAVMLLAAGLFPALERAYAWRVFGVLPPIVFTYLFVTALAVAGLWSATDEIKATQKALTAQLLPALLFLLMVTCDLRAILKLGPRVLGVFACAMATILLAIVIVYLAMRNVLPPEGWKMLAALSATWTGGSANLVAVKQSIGLSEQLLPAVLLADALCYSTWIVLLFSAAAIAPRFDRWTGASSRAAVAGAHPAGNAPQPPDGAAGAHIGSVLLWLGGALAIALAAAALAAAMPTSSYFTLTSWTVLFATIAGLVVAQTPLARLPGPGGIASALLALLVAVLASQSSFAGLGDAPLFVLAGFLVLALHALMLAGCARVFRFDLHLAGVASLAQVGGPASAPVLAAAYD
ncbi:MAG TPA: DUF819 family protein, partial [Xanthomonadales bacterium]|nr:DUF819 family protein [Xanthomonadales bacterium]